MEPERPTLPPAKPTGLHHANAWMPPLIVALAIIALLGGYLLTNHFLSSNDNANVSTAIGNPAPAQTILPETPSPSPTAAIVESTPSPTASPTPSPSADPDITKQLKVVDSSLSQVDGDVRSADNAPVDTDTVQ